MSAVDDNDSGVSEDVNLNDIDTESKFNKITKQADKAERDLERAEKARIKTEAEVQKSAELLKNFEEKQIQAKTASPLWNMGGNDPHREHGVTGLGTPVGQTDENSGFNLPNENQTISGKIDTGAILPANYNVTDKTSSSPFGDEDMARGNYIEQILKNRKHIRDLEEEQKQIKAHQQEVLGNVRGGFGKVQGAFPWSSNPVGKAKSTILTNLGRAGFAGAIASLVIQQVESLYNQIVQEVKDMFRAGGALDIRKDVLNEMKQISELETLVDIHQGRVFFTSANGETLRQGIPQTTNTMRRVNGYKQYIQEFDR